jgi:hypothetical protein
MNLPSVTCLQLSYGRPTLSVEAVECYLRQTYSNKRLVIVNTHPSPIVFNEPHDDIQVHNIKPLNRLSDVYRFGMDLIDTDYFCVWDDDDLFMPWHIEDRVEFSLEHPEFDAIGHTYCVYSEDNKLKELGQNMFVAQYLYKNNGIRPDSGIACWDSNWDSKPWKKGFVTFPAKPSYVYRWGTGENHISGFAGEEGQHQIYLRNIEEKHKIKLDFPWEPKWRRDYVEDMENLLKTDKRSPFRT